MVAVAIVLATSPAASRQAPPVDAAMTVESLTSNGIPAEEASALATAMEGLAVVHDRYAPDDRSPIALTLLVKPSSAHLAERIIEATRSALGLFDEWYGPYPHTVLTVVDAAWNSGREGASYPALVVLNTRWLAPAEDRSLERTLIAAIGRQYWHGVVPRDASQGWFEEGLVLYTGARAIHDRLDGRHVATTRYLGGFVPHVLRSLLLSPRPADPRPRLQRFAELDEPRSAPWRAWPVEEGSEAVRAHRALATLERYIGWPAVQQALMTFRAEGGGTPDAFAAVVSRQRGVDLGWFFDEAFRFDARFDYGVARFTSEPRPGETSKYETVVGIERYGDAVFAGTSQPAVEGSAGAQALPLRLSFADGTEVVEWWDGRQPGVELSYLSTSPALAASVDPDVFLLLDDDLMNNSRVRQAVRAEPSGVRLALHWLAWLQNAMLTYASIV